MPVVRPVPAGSFRAARLRAAEFCAPKVKRALELRQIAKWRLAAPRRCLASLRDLSHPEGVEVDDRVASSTL